MKYDLLWAVRDVLERECSSKETADTYYKALKKVTGSQQFNTASEMDQEQIKKSLLAIRSASEFSAAKNGLKTLKALYLDAPIPEESWFSEIQVKKSRRRKKAPPPIELDTVKRKVNALKDRKLKLAYRTALASGLRVSELADLRASDMDFLEDDRILFRVRKGKGNQPREVMGLPDPYLHAQLKEFGVGHSPEDTLFYSSSHMVKQAGELGFECHDLRRVFAQEYRDSIRAEGSSLYVTNGKVMKALGHSRFRVTARYLRRKINKGGGTNHAKGRK